MMTPFSKQVEIVAEFYLHNADDYEELVYDNNLGFPLAVVVYKGGVDESALNDLSRGWITQTFIAVVDELGLDIYGEYDSLREMIDLYEQG